jgi:hypothetical protein
MQLKAIAITNRKVIPTETPSSGSIRNWQEFSTQVVAERSRTPPGKQATRSVSGRRGESEVRIYDSLTILTPEFLQKLT